MSNLGNLYFDVALRDMTDADIDKIKKKLEKVGVKMGVDVDRKTFEANIKEALKKKTFKVNIEASKNIKKAAIEANKNVLGRSVSDFLKDNTFKANVDLVVRKASVQQAIREAFAQAGLKYNTTASDARQNLIDTRTAKTNAYVEAQRALTELRKAQAASAHAANQQADAMERVNKTGERQKGVMATIREQVANAYAIYRVGRFLEGVIRISGEFQQQHVALQTILGDAQKADVLFSRIKGLAVESPFKFGELTGYAKQLSAFSIPYEELFDTLKRFGELSAGLGVDMGRIILAYGQVRSAEFLKGTELRQFTEAGIPLVAELAKRYTELEGTLVSVGDVYDRISKKQVAFSDVKAVLWDLTSEGGRFFNMQSELTDTLKGKLDKLIDSYEIFLSEVGNSNNEALGGTLDLLTSILAHWRDIQNAIVAVTAAYGTYKAVLLSVNAIQKTAIKLDVIQKAITSMQFLGKATNGVSAAFKLLGNVVSKNPIGVFAGILASMVGMLVMMRSESDSTADVITELNAKIQEEAEMTDIRRQKASDMATIMTNEKKSIEERSKAYDTLVSIYPNIFDGMSREQAMLMDELKLRNKIIDAAKEESKEKLKSNLVDLDKKIAEAKRKRDTSSVVYDRFGNQIDLKSTKQKKQEAQAVVDLETERLLLVEKIAAVEKHESELQAQRTARWYTESKKIAEEAGLKSLIPTDKETDVWEYFDRIKQGMDDINRKKELLNPESDNYSTMLGNLDDELKAYEKIYYDVLGGKNEEAIKAAEEARKERERRAKEEAKQNKKFGEEAAKAYAEGVKSEMERIASQWDLYKQLFEATGDKTFASTAFSVTPVWDEAANQMYEEFEKSAEQQGFKGTISFGISDALAKEHFGELYDSWKKIKDRIEKNGIDLKVNTANAIKDTQTIEEKIDSITNQMNADLAVQEGLFGKDSIEYKSAAENWKKQIQDLKTELWELSPAFKDVFKDTVGMSIGQIEKLKKETQSIIDAINDGTPNEKTGMIDFTYGGKNYSTDEEGLNKLIELLEKLSEKSHTVGDNFKRVWSYIAGEEYKEQGKLKFGDIVGDLASIASGASEAAQSLSSMFDALGDSKTALSFDLAGNIFGGVSKIGQGIAAKDPFAVLGGITGIITSIAQHHDKKLDRVIQKSQLEVQKLSNEYKNLETAIERQLGGATAGQTKKMMESLKKQRSELQKQYDAEDDKKKTDKSKLEDYKQQMTELDDQIKHFYEDLASEQYGVDIKGWAGQIADALTDAFAKGEDAAKAFDNTVADILRSLATEAIKLQFIEPAMANLKSYMFGQNGIFTDNSESGTDLSANEAAGLGKELDKLKGQIEASNDYWDKINDAVGSILDSADKSASRLSKSVQGVTENTADLVASYLNGVRGDVSANRTLIEQLVNVGVPQMSMLAEAQLQQLQQVAANTKRNADAADRIYELVNKVVDKGSNKLKI